MSELDLSVVVPVYNNASTLGELIDRLTAVLEPLHLSYELIFVDDGSKDESLALLEERASQDPHVRPFAMARNFGSQSALCAGFDQVRGKRTVCLDADLENYPEDIPALLVQLDRGYELACGVREERRDGLLTRRLPSRIFNAYVRWRVRTHVRDLGCGLRAMDSEVIRGLSAEGEQRRLMSPVLIRRARSVVEVPIRHHPKELTGGHTILSITEIALDFFLLTARRPFLWFGLTSVLAGATGIALAAAGAPRWATIGWILLVGGFLGTLASVIGEYVQRLYQLAQGVPFYQLRGDDDSPTPRDGGSR